MYNKKEEIDNLKYKQKVKIESIQNKTNNGF